MLATVTGVAFCAALSLFALLSLRSAVVWVEHTMQVQQTTAAWVGDVLDATAAPRVRLVGSPQSSPNPRPATERAA
jgi:hypothetical protein